MVSEIDRFNFDLNGYVILRNVISQNEIELLENELDTIPDLKPNEWYGHIHRENYAPDRGRSYQQIYEAGPTYQSLINHPAYFEHVKEFLGNQDDFDSSLGPAYIDECFALIRGKGESIGIHSGGHKHTKRTQFSYHNGEFHCGQINIFIPLTNIGEGDGATVVIPGSHKSNLAHPGYQAILKNNDKDKNSIEVHLNKGDVLLFVDAICHGSAERLNEGLRKVVIYRFGPAWGNSRFGYLPSKGLLENCTEEQRKIVQPQTYRIPPHVEAKELMASLRMTAPTT
jgi:hypothetical protein